MVRIQVSAEVAEQLMKPGEAIEIVDAGGRRIGFVSRPITDDEISEARRLADAQPQGSSLDEVWKRIRSRDSSQ
jgi:hypothetical protein